MFFEIAGKIVSILNQLFHNIYTHGKINNLQKLQNKLNSTGFEIYKIRMSYNYYFQNSYSKQHKNKQIMESRVPTAPLNAFENMF